MNNIPKIYHLIPSYLGLSRFPHSLLNLAQPLFAAFITLERLPSVIRIFFVSLTAFFGYLSIFAINDLLDKKIDQEGYLNYQKQPEVFDLDSSLVEHHPLATGSLNFKQALIWSLFSLIITIIGSWLINPILILLLGLVLLLEIIYCKLAKISPLKIIITGLLVTLGTWAGWFAFQNEINIPLLLTIGIWSFTWEIGGRNITNDFFDLQKDKKLKIKTIPVIYGTKVSSYLVFSLLTLTILFGLLLGYLANMHWIYYPLSSAIGWALLLIPSLKLLDKKTPEAAIEVFNKASFYPLLMLVPVLIDLLF